MSNSAERLCVIKQMSVNVPCCDHAGSEMLQSLIMLILEIIFFSQYKPIISENCTKSTHPESVRLGRVWRGWVQGEWIPCHLCLVSLSPTCDPSITSFSFLCYWTVKIEWKKRFIFITQTLRFSQNGFPWKYPNIWPFPQRFKLWRMRNTSCH